MKILFFYSEVLRDRDPSGVGLPDAAARGLLRTLLAADPADRPSAAEAPWTAAVRAPLESGLC